MRESRSEADVLLLLLIERESGGWFGESKLELGLEEVERRCFRIRLCNARG